jgi:glucosylceramidase
VPASPAPAKPVTGGILGATKECVDVTAGVSDNGTTIGGYKCHKPLSDNQTWKISGDGTIRSLGKCMTVGGDGKSTDSAIVLWDCLGKSTQKWRTGPNSSLVNPASGKCLDDAAGGQGGVPFRLAPCDGGADQRWTLPT